MSAYYQWRTLGHPSALTVIHNWLKHSINWLPHSSLQPHRYRFRAIALRTVLAI